MKKTFHSSLTILLVLGAFSASTSLVQAATITLESAPNQTGTVITVSVHPEGKKINAVEGEIVIPSGVSVSSIGTGDSALLVWPVPPHFEQSSHRVVFTGGTPAGLPENANGILFRFVVSGVEGKKYTFTTQNTIAYLADGKGTALPIPSYTTSTTLLAVATGTPVVPQTDSEKPEIAAEIGRDATVFGGKYFVTFYGRDSGSGIARFEVKEGWFGSFTPTDHYYILHDQSRSAPVWVRGTDFAGNTTTILVPSSNQSLLIPSLILLFLILLIWFLVRRHTKSKRAI